MHKQACEIIHRIEEIVDRIIPLCLILLAVIILAELFFKEFAEQYSAPITFADRFVVGVFVLDLVFKWLRIRKLKLYLRLCWMDIIAIFPFATLFRLFEDIYAFSIGAAEIIARGQPVFHEGIELEKEVEIVMKEAEKTGKISRMRLLLRSARFSRLLRVFTRMPRFLKAFAFYERPVHKRAGEKRKHKKTDKEKFAKKKKAASEK